MDRPLSIGFFVPKEGLPEVAQERTRTRGKLPLTRGKPDPVQRGKLDFEDSLPRRSRGASTVPRRGSLAMVVLLKTPLNVVRHPDVQSVVLQRPQDVDNVRSCEHEGASEGGDVRFRGMLDTAH